MRQLLAIAVCFGIAGWVGPAEAGGRARAAKKVAVVEVDEDDIEMAGEEEEAVVDDGDRRARWRDDDDDEEGDDRDRDRDRDRYRDDDDDDGDDRRARRRDRDDDDGDRWDDGDREEGRRGRRERRQRVGYDDRDDRGWDDDGWRERESDRGERIDRRGRRKARAKAKAWHVAIGPYLWASSVDANVSLGKTNVNAGVDFMDITKQAKYGFAALVEARYRRFAVYGDLTYGVVGLDGAREVGPFMVEVAGEAASLMVDGAAGYRAMDAGWLTVEPRVGLRYQRTAIEGAVNVAGADVSRPEYVDAAADALVGGQVVLRPLSRIGLAATADYGVFGVSTRTWSAAADASWRVHRRVMVTLGWRTMTTDRPNVSITMHGPRGAVQLMF